MRVLVVAPQPFYSSRGTPLSVYYRSLTMAEQGVAIDLLTYGSGKAVRIPGVRIRRIPRFRFVEPVPVGPSWRKLFLDAFMVVWTIGLLLRNRYDVVHAHEEAVFWCRFLKPVFRFKLVYDMHSSLPQQLQNFRFTRSSILIGTFAGLENTCVKAANAVVTVCPDLRDRAIRLRGSADDILLIENSLTDEVQVDGPADPDPVTVADGFADFGQARSVILYAGTFEAYQGVELLVEAFAKLVKIQPEARLLLVGGDARQVERIRQRVESLGLGGACQLTGSVPRKRATAYIHSAQVVVSLRLQGNNTPLKIYELMASGRPMVATKVRAHTQVLDDSICFLAEPNAESLANSLRTALNDETESARRVANAMARFESDYSRPAYVDKIRQLLSIVS